MATKNLHRLLSALFLSSIIHAVVVCTLIWVNMLAPERAKGDGEYVVAVEIMSEEVETASSKEAGAAPSKKVGAASAQRQAEKAGSASPTDQSLPSGAGGTSEILAQIRRKIEATKRYPRLAKRMKIEGRPTLMFEINSDGSVKYAKIVHSSGEAMIDRAALDTVKRAAPLPYYTKPIKLAIRYELK